MSGRTGCGGKGVWWRGGRVGKGKGGCVRSAVGRCEEEGVEVRRGVTLVGRRMDGAGVKWVWEWSAGRLVVSGQGPCPDGDAVGVRRAPLTVMGPRVGMSLGSGVKVENQREGERQGGPKRKARMWDLASVH